MCGRLSLAASTDAILTLFGLEAPEAALPADLLEHLAPRYNIAPTQPIVALRRSREGDRELSAFRWGLVPHWAEGLKGPPLINARAETVATRNAFRDAFARRRCLVPSDGFYEWQQTGRVRQPHRICRRDRGLLAYAGLWSRWRGPDGPLDSLTIVTVPPNAVVAALHDRMPAILAPSDFDAWLAGDPDAARTLLRPAPDDWLEAYPISRRVNKVASDDPSIWDEINPETDGPPLPLFDD